MAYICTLFDILCMDSTNKYHLPQEITLECQLHILKMTKHTIQLQILRRHICTRQEHQNTLRYLNQYLTYCHNSNKHVFYCDLVEQSFSKLEVSSLVFKYYVNFLTVTVWNSIKCCFPVCCVKCECLLQCACSCFVLSCPVDQLWL